MRALLDRAHGLPVQAVARADAKGPVQDLFTWGGDRHA